MATATASRKKPSASTNGKGNGNGNAESKVIDLPVKFGGVSFDSGASVQVIFEKGTINARDVERLFCGHRLDAKLKAIKDGEDPKQMEFEGIEGHAGSAEGSCDVNGYSSTPDFWKTRFYFNLDQIDELEFLHLRKKSGRVIIRDLGAIPEDEESPQRSDIPGQRKLLDTDGPKVEELGPYGIGPVVIDQLKEVGLKTITAIGEFTAKGKPLTDIVGIGAKKAQAIAEACEAYYKDHPESEEPDDEEDEDEDEDT